MATNVHHVLRDALEDLKFPTSSYKLAFSRALIALIEDADASAYEPSEANSDAFDFLHAVITDLHAEDDEEIVELPDAEADDDEDDDPELDEELNFDNSRLVAEDDDEDEDDDIV